jgi:hypothetical protein
MKESQEGYKSADMFTKLETLLLYWELEAAQWYGDYSMTTEVQLSLLLSLYKSLRSIEKFDCWKR